MVDRPFTPGLNFEHYFRGLARQYVDFHQALGELLDNSLSAPRVDEVGQPQAVTIEIILKQINEGKFELQVADSGRGMSLEDLAESVFNPGGQGAHTGPMNEHGFGLKNALALLSAGNENPFKLMTRDEDLGTDEWYKVNGPYSEDMRVLSGTNEEWAEDLNYLQAARTGTKVWVKVDLHYLKSIYRVGRNHSLDTLMSRLGEHIGIMHRYYIAKGNRIFLRYKGLQGDWVEHCVPAISVPFDGAAREETVTFALDGDTYNVVYRRGLLDYTAKDATASARLGWPYPLKIYYQGSNARCGVDVVVRDRVIRTAEFESIWPEISKTVEFNRFVGELKLDHRFRTSNNKTGLDPHGRNWEQLRGRLQEAEFKPERTTRSHSEESLRVTYTNILQGEHPGCQAGHFVTWDGGCEIDILMETTAETRLYELKVVPSQVLDVYQLLMGWDGAVRDGKRPTRAILVASQHSEPVRAAIRDINGRIDGVGATYNFELATIAELGVPTP